jgi:rhamnosyltransferase subunit B
MKFVLASVGSAGDAHPYIALGHALLQRGHEVAFFSNWEHQKATEAAGLEFLPAGDGLNYASAVANPDLWHPVKGLGVLWRNLLAPSIIPLYKTLSSLQQTQPQLRVLAGPQMMGARLAQEHLGLHLTSVYTSPGLLRSHHGPVTIANTHWSGSTPQWFLRTLWHAVDRYKLDPMARATLTRLCSELGVAAPPPQISLFGQWMHSPHKGLTLYPEWFAPRKPDHIPQLVYGDFASYTLDDQATLPADMQAFIHGGSAPVVLMFGTAMAHAQTQFAIWQEALARCNLRGIFLSAHAQQFPAHRAAHILYASYAPFSQLLPQAAALVHHGGIGSCAQALAAGIAQIIQPCAHDQFENARCIQALGAGQRLKRNADIKTTMQSIMRLKQAPNPSALAHYRQLSEKASLNTLCEILERS